MIPFKFLKFFILSLTTIVYAADSIINLRSGTNLLLQRFTVLKQSIHVDNNDEGQDETVRRSSGEYFSAAVASENPQCSKIGKSILVAGGNAVDSAISTLLCIGVINNFSSGIGG